MRTLTCVVGGVSSSDGLHLSFAYQGQSLARWYGIGDELFDDWWRTMLALEPKTVVG